MGKRKNFIREKRVYCGDDYLEVDIVPVMNIPEPGRGKEKESSPRQKSLNEKRSKRLFVQLANTNFGINDYHISATYNNDHLPVTLEEAEKNVHNYLNRLKRRMKKTTGKDLKYMLVTEYTPEEGEGGQIIAEGEKQGEQDKEQPPDKKTKAVRIHHHIIINGDIDRDEAELLWCKGRINWNKTLDADYLKSLDSLGFVNCDRLQPNENGVEGLVNYINKRKKGCKKWSCSQNLKRPKVVKNDHKYSFRKMRELAKTPEDKTYWRKVYKGYEPTKIDFVYNDYTGYSAYIKLQRLRR